MSLPIDERGYILPDVIDPGEYICVQVYIPAADEYIWAFSGAIEGLTKWTSWERDGTDRAAQAAQVWKRAVDYSHENGWIGRCGMSEECCQAIVDAINNISININMECGGGGGGESSPDRDWKLPVDWDDGLPSSPAPIPDDETDVNAGDLCDTAHQTHARLYEFIDNYPDLVFEQSPYDELRDYILAIGFFVSPTAVVLYQAMATVTGMAYDALERDTLEFWMEMKEEFVCAVVENTHAAALYSWLTNYINQNAPNFFVKQWLLTIMQMVDWGLLYDGEFNIEPEYVGSDCSACAPVQSLTIARQSLNMSQAIEVGEVFTVPSTWIQNGGGTNKMFLLEFWEDGTFSNRVEVSYDVVGWSGYTVATNATNPFTAQEFNKANQLETIFGYQVPLEVYSGTNCARLQLNSGSVWTVDIRVTAITG